MYSCAFWHPRTTDQRCAHIAFSPVRSPSGMTDTSQRSCLAGMGRNYTSPLTRRSAISISARQAHGVQQCPMRVPSENPPNLKANTGGLALHRAQLLRVAVSFRSTLSKMAVSGANWRGIGFSQPECGWPDNTPSQRCNL